MREYYEPAHKGESIKNIVRRILILEIEYYKKYLPNQLKSLIDWIKSNKDDRDALNLYFKKEVMG